MQHQSPPPRFADYPRSGGPQLPPVGVHLIGEAISLFQRRPSAWIVAALPLTVLSAAYQAVNLGIGRLQPKGAAMTDPAAILPFLGLQFGLIFLYYIAYYGMLGGMCRMASEAIDGKAVEAKDAFRITMTDLGRIGIALVIGAMAYMAGIMACILPGLLVFGFTMVVAPLIFVGGRGGVDSIVESFRLTKPYLWAALGIHLLLSIISLFGVSFCFVGQLITLPIYAITVTLAYRRLVAQDTGSAA